MVSMQTENLFLWTKCYRMGNRTYIFEDAYIACLDDKITTVLVEELTVMARWLTTIFHNKTRSINRSGFCKFALSLACKRH